MKKRIQYSMLTVLLVVIGIGTILFSKNSENLEAAPSAPVGYLPFSTTNTPGINILDSQGFNPETGRIAEIPGAYGTLFRLTDKVEYVVKGEEADIYQLPGTDHKIYRFKAPVDPDPSKEKSVTVKNAAIYRGRYIDLKCVITGMEFAAQGTPEEPSVYFFAPDFKQSDLNPGITDVSTWAATFLLIGTTDSTLTPGTYQYNDSFSYIYEFYDHETGAAVDFRGIWNYANMNTYKSVSIPHGASDYSDIYVNDDVDVGVKHNTKLQTPATGFSEFYGANSWVNEPESRFTHLIHDRKNYEITMQSRYNDPDYGAPMAVLYHPASLVRVAPSQPLIYGEKNSATHKKNDGSGDPDPEYQKLKYSILETIGANADNRRDTKFEIETEVPGDYDIDKDNIKVMVNATNEDRTALFTIEYGDGGTNKSKVIIKAIDPTSDDFVGVVDKNAYVKVPAGTDYRIYIEASPNAEIDIDTYGYVNNASSPDNGYLTDYDLVGNDLTGIKTRAIYEFEALNGNGSTGEPLNGIEMTPAKILYEGKPTGEAGSGSVPYGGTILESYPLTQINPGDTWIGDLLKSGWETAVDTSNTIDQPVTARYGTIPDTSGLAVGDEVEVPIILTSAKGVETEVKVKVTVRATDTRIIVKFVDEGNTEIPNSEVIVNGKVGDPDHKLSTDQTIIDRLDELANQGYSFVERDPAGDEVSFTIPETTVTYKMQGSFYVAKFPATIDFRNLTYNAQDQRVDDPDYDTDLVISDSRAVKNGWKVTAKVQTPMTHTTNGVILVDSLRYVANGTEKTLGTSAQAIFVDTSGNPSVNITSTWGTTKDTDGVKLVARASDMRKGSYEGEILWEVGPTP